MRARRACSSVFLFALVACGGSGTAGGSVSTPAPTAPAPTPSPTASPTPSVPVYTPAPAFVPTAGVGIAAGKCVNMGNHLEAPDEGEWGRAIADDDFQIIKAAGFDSVRIPVRWSAHAMTTAPYTIDAAWMARVRHVVDRAKAAGLSIMLNMHHYEEIFDDPTGHATRFAEMWKQIAAEFDGEDDATFWFELLNEPHKSLNNGNLNALLLPALVYVREKHPTRPVVIGGENWSGVDSLDTLQLPDDPYVIPTFHTYDPFDFTHQGATWQDPTPPLGRVYGSAADYADLASRVAKVKAYMDRTGRQVFLGEYGVNDVAGIPLSERIKYYALVSGAYASIGVQSCAWGYTNTFRLRDGSAWLPGMVEAIRTTTTLR